MIGQKTLHSFFRAAPPPPPRKRERSPEQGGDAEVPRGRAGPGDNPDRGGGDPGAQLI